MTPEAATSAAVLEAKRDGCTCTGLIEFGTLNGHLVAHLAHDRHCALTKPTPPTEPDGATVYHLPTRSSR